MAVKRPGKSKKKKATKAKSKPKSAPVKPKAKSKAKARPSPSRAPKSKPSSKASSKPTAKPARERPISGWMKRDIEKFIREVEAGKRPASEIEAIKVQVKIYSKQKYLHDAIKQAREWYNGFSSADGFNLNNVRFLTNAQVTKLEVAIKHLREQLASPHIEVKPRNKLEHRALEILTRQTWPPGRKKFAVHTSHGLDTVIRYGTKERTVKDKLGRKRKQTVPTAEIGYRTKRGQVIVDKFFSIADYATESERKSFKSMLPALKRMVKQMPDGWYTFVNANHGMIGIAMPRDEVIRQVVRQWKKYDSSQRKDMKAKARSLASSIAGMKKLDVASAKQARREYEQRRTEQLAMNRQRKLERAAVAKEFAQHNLQREMRDRRFSFVKPKK